MAWHRLYDEEESRAWSLRLVTNGGRQAPRERLLTCGPQALRDDQLLTIILQSGNRHVSVMELANRVLARANGLYGLFDITVEELVDVTGIGLAKALQIAAAIKLGRRLVRKPTEHRVQIRCADGAAEYVMDRLRFLKKEHFVILHLDTKHCVVTGEETVSIGSLDRRLYIRAKSSNPP